ncbi:MAG: hypothetical protein ACRC62_19785 [Microcoleus sp.]
MWTPENPTDYSRFTPTDIPAFLEYWERTRSTFSLDFAGAFIDGLSQPYLEIVSANPPAWVQVMLRWRYMAQQAYGLGLDVSKILESQGLFGDFDFGFSPEEIAEVPPAIINSFLNGYRFSYSWIKNLDRDTRVTLNRVLSLNQLKNNSPQSIGPIVEQILRREMLDPDADIMAIAEKELKAIAHRAQLISRTEPMRMMNLGILDSLEQQGDTLAYVMPHLGSCEHCQRLLDGRVFRIATLRENLFKNFGVSPDKWVAALPQHPQCRHSPLRPPVKFKKVLRDRVIPAKGVLLEWYGLPGGKTAMEALGLVPKPDEWLRSK